MLPHGAARPRGTSLAGPGSGPGIGAVRAGAGLVDRPLPNVFRSVAANNTLECRGYGDTAFVTLLSDVVESELSIASTMQLTPREPLASQTLCPSGARQQMRRPLMGSPARWILELRRSGDRRLTIRTDEAGVSVKPPTTWTRESELSCRSGSGFPTCQDDHRRAHPPHFSQVFTVRNRNAITFDRHLSMSQQTNRTYSQLRTDAKVVSRIEGRPVFGGTPADASVLQAIAKLKASGRAVMFYPFLLMDIQAGNGLADPWSGATDQPVVPWRGRITLGKAPGQAGSSDKTPAAAEEVAAFFGEAAVGDFEVSGDTVELSSARRVVVSAVHPALRAPLRSGGRGRGLLHRLGVARAVPGPRLGRRLSGGAGALRSGGGRAGGAGARASRSAMRRTGRNTSGISRPTGRATCSTISTRCGLRPTSTSSGSTTTCRCRTGGTGPGRATPRPGRSTISLTSRAMSRAARGTTGTTTSGGGRARRRSGCRSPTGPTASTGSSATRTW